MTRTLNLIAMVVFASSLFMRSTDPVIPQIASGLSVDPSTAALLATAFTLPYALIQPLLGALADTMNKARLMLLCMFVLAGASIASALAVNFEMLVAARIVAGLAAGGVVPISFAIVGDLVPVARRQVAMGRLLFAIMTGNLLGATFAGLIGDMAGWRAVFFAVGSVGAIVLVVAIPAFRSIVEKPKQFDLSTIGPNYRTIFSNPLAKICFGAVFLEALFMYGVFPYIATLLHEAGETRASIAGIVLAGFGLGGAVYGLAISRILPWTGETLLMRAGGIIMGLCLVVIALRLPWPVEFVNFIVLGLGFYFLHAVIQIYASELAPAARGTALALHSFFFFLGHAAGPIVYGIGLATFGISPVLYVGAGVLSAVGFICARNLRRHPHPSAGV
jgi:MFS transporter, DHA1 family, inner membrane transport protein